MLSTEIGQNGKRTSEASSFLSHNERRGSVMVHSGKVHHKLWTNLGNGLECLASGAFGRSQWIRRAAPDGGVCALLRFREPCHWDHDPSSTGPRIPKHHDPALPWDRRKQGGHRTVRTFLKPGPCRL